ncbi:MAG TPA: repressor LexA [Candidatus Moranbacteria bacterium]|nr:repressor LexA [Candidatus Moranbacteria bacterium]HAT74550.1 repressor LexA [Candidatus Moranbacteria bacterium]
MSIKLTSKQRKVLEFIYTFLENSGFPPSISDLKEELNVSSNQSVLNFLYILEKKEYIKREGGQARGIKILPLGYREIGKNPLIKMAGISAGGSYVESFVNAFSFFPLAEKVLENEKINESKDRVFVIQVAGDSMINAGIDDGDSLLIKESKEYKSGDIVIARTDAGTTVKRFIADGGKRYLQPENPAYEKMIIIPGEVQFQGKVILNLSKINK